MPNEQARRERGACRTPPDFWHLAPIERLKSAAEPLGFLERAARLVLYAEIPERLAQGIERAMCQDQRRDITLSKPQVEHAKGKPSCTRDKSAMPPLIVGVPIAEEGGRDKQGNNIPTQTARSGR